MSIRHGLLALLAERPMYGYQLRAELEERTGATWPLNIGQVYHPADRIDPLRLIETGIFIAVAVTATAAMAYLVQRRRTIA